MRRYDSYKNSGQQWLGEIPSHWNMKRLRLLLIENTCNDFNEHTNILLQFKYGEIVRKPNQYESIEEATAIGNYIKVAPQDIMINGLNLNYDFISQRVAQVKEAGIITAAYISLRPTVLADSKYYTYLLKSMDAKKMFHGMGRGIRLTLSYNELKNHFIPYPPKNEQNIIVAYLDKTTSEIDKAIAQQQRMIDLLNERKQIIIQQAVTKGLNPNVKVKDSGQQWLGKIPSHWECRPIKQFKSKCKNAFVDGPFGSNLKSEHFIDNGEVFVVESGTITSGVFKHSKLTKTISLKHFQTICRSECKEDDVIIAKIGANYGMAGILPNLSKRAVVSGNSLKITLDHTKIENQYFVYLMQVAKMMGGFKDMVSETAQPALSLGGLNNMYFPLPNLGEQKNILEYIDTNICPIQTIIQNCEKLIERLKERKQIIINEAVTGKIKVV